MATIVLHSATLGLDFCLQVYPLLNSIHSNVTELSLILGLHSRLCALLCAAPYCMHTGTGVTSFTQHNTDISILSLYKLSSSVCMWLVWLACENTQSSVQHLPSHVHCNGLLNTAFALILAGTSVFPLTLT